MKFLDKLKLAFDILTKELDVTPETKAETIIEEEETFKVVVGAELKFEVLVPHKNLKRTEELNEFAKTFDHKIVDYRNTIVIVKKKGQIISYCQIVNTPMCYPAFHTNKDICSRRDVIEIMKAFTGWAKIQNGEGNVAVPIGSKTFLPHILKKLGFYPQHSEIYTVDGDN